MTTVLDFLLRSHDYGTPSKSISENVDMTSNPFFLAGREANSHMFALTISFSRGEVWGGILFGGGEFSRGKNPTSSRMLLQKVPERNPKTSPKVP